MMGYISITVLYDIHKGKEIKLPEEFKAEDDIIDTGILFITPENIDEHFPE